MGMARPPSVRTASSVPGPLVIGVFRPVVVLPTTLLERGDNAEMELVLAHELAHCRRWDLAWDWLPTVVRGLFFFHPLVWLAFREARLATEIACDQLAIADTAKPASAYAAVLLRIAIEVSRSGSRRPLGAIGAFESYQSLKRRLRALANTGTMSPRRLRLTIIPAFVIAVAMILPWRLAPQTVAGPTGDAPPSAHDKASEPISGSDLERDYEIKKAALKAALEASTAADKVRDEAQERWLTANGLFQQHALSEEDVRGAKLTWDTKVYEAVRKREAANMAQVEASVAKSLLAAGRQGEQALKEARRRGDYEIKKAIVRCARADCAAADKTRDEMRERWLTANRLFQSHALSEEEVRSAKLLWDEKSYEAASKQAALAKAKAEADIAKTLLAIGQQPDLTLKEATPTGTLNFGEVRVGASSDGKVKALGFTATEKRRRRWQLNFNTREAVDQLNQFAALGVILAVPEQHGGFRVFSELRVRQPRGIHMDDLNQITGLGFACQEPETVSGIGRELGMPTPAYLLVFIPKELEEKMSRMEEAYWGVKEDQIRWKMYFKVVSRGTGYDVVVDEQATGPAPGKPNQQLKEALDKDVLIDFSPGPLKEALNYLADRYEFQFKIDDQAFQKRGIKNVGQTKVSAPKASSQLADVLQKILDQVNATFRVSQTGDSLIIVPK
jgi:hypothetical protein